MIFFYIKNLLCLSFLNHTVFARKPEWLKHQHQLLFNIY